MAEFGGCIRAAGDLLCPGARGTASVNFTNAISWYGLYAPACNMTVGKNSTSDVQNTSIREQRESRSDKE